MPNTVEQSPTYFEVSKDHDDLGRVTYMWKLLGGLYEVPANSDSGLVELMYLNQSEAVSLCYWLAERLGLEVKDG